MSNKTLGMGVGALVVVIISIAFWGDMSGQITRIRNVAAIGAEKDARVVKIGGVFALSGGGAYWGEDEMRAVQLAIDESNAKGGVNGRAIELIVEDAPANENTQKGISAFKKLVEVDHVDVVIGPTWDIVAQAIAPIADQTKTVIVSPSSSSGVEKNHDYLYFFSTALPEYAEMVRMSEYAKSNGWNRIGIVRSSDSFSETVSTKLKEGGETAGVDVVADLTVSGLTTTDFRSEIVRMKKESVDAVYIVFSDEASKCPFLKQAKELGLTKQILSSLSTESPDSLEKCAAVMEGIRYTAQKQPPQYSELLENYKERFGMEPTAPATANAYDAATVVIEEMRKGNDTPEKLRTALLTRQFSGALGDNLSFSPNGYLVMPSEQFVIKTVRNGEFVVVE